jgi:hypothetical protein
LTLLACPSPIGDGSMAGGDIDRTIKVRGSSPGQPSAVTVVGRDAVFLRPGDPTITVRSDSSVRIVA